MRYYSMFDRFIAVVDAGLHTVFLSQQASRPNPGVLSGTQPTLSAAEKRRSQGFMRVNHSGEVCAQALYRGQLVFAQDTVVRNMLQQAAIEETDHLAWTHQQLQALGTHRSWLNLFWYVNSFCIGLLAARCGDAWSLGFVEETERQVAAHLQGHLERLKNSDVCSQAIIAQMQQDEEQHRTSAEQLGAKPLPAIIKMLMRWHAKILTTIAYYV